MDERDYLQLAKKKSDEEIMNEYWLNVARKKVWISKDGTETPFKQLELGHVLNIINGLMLFENQNCKYVVSALVQELTVRIKRKTPKYVEDALTGIKNLFGIVLEKNSTLNDEEKKNIKDLFYSHCETIREEFVGR